MEHKITLTFESKQLKDAFSGWYLDGGGEQEFMQTAEDNDNLLIVTRCNYDINNLIIHHETYTDEDK